MNYTHPLRIRGLETIKLLPEDLRNTLQALRDRLPDITATTNAIYYGVNGFKASPTQIEVAQRLNGSFDSTDTEAELDNNRLLQGQRGLGKSTTVAAVAMHRWIHDPDHKILILSGNSKLAKDIAELMVLTITAHPAWEILAPAASDKQMAFSFNINNAIIAPSKTKSLDALSIMSQMQGYRADLAILDDVEQIELSDTAPKRQKLLKKVGDVSSIVLKNEIQVIGTPQSYDSIYTTLRNRGFSLTMFPGRVPNPNDSGFESTYGIDGSWLHPRIKALTEDPDNCTGYGISGNLGIPTFPEFLDEEYQLSQEAVAEGTGAYELQQLLDIRKMNGNTYPLLVSDIIIGKVDPRDFPIDHTRLRSNKAGKYRELVNGANRRPYNHRVAAIDPSVSSKAGGDAFGVCVVLSGHDTYHVPAMGIYDGGGKHDNVLKAVNLLIEHDIHLCSVEVNQGGEFVLHALSKALDEINSQRISQGMPVHGIKFEALHNSQNKEQRIINTLSPILASRALVLDHDVLAYNEAVATHYKDTSRTVMHQIEFITKSKGSLKSDDAIDVLSMGIQYAIDQAGSSIKSLSETAQRAKAASAHVARRVAAGRKAAGLSTKRRQRV